MNNTLFDKQVIYNIKDYGQIPDTEKVVINMIPMVKSAFLTVKVPEKILNNLNIYLDDIYKNPDSVSRHTGLAGAIKMLNGKKGKQLFMDPEHKLVKPYTDFLMLCSQVYSSQMHNYKFENNKIKLNVCDIWSVHQYETDYNPQHFHTNPVSDYGLSSFLHIKLPEQLIDGSKLKKKNENAKDGLTTLRWDDMSNDISLRLFKFGGIRYSKGETGVLYLFPQWLEHQVYPFFGKGERRSVAANVSVTY